MILPSANTVPLATNHATQVFNTVENKPVLVYGEKGR